MTSIAILPGDLSAAQAPSPKRAVQNPDDVINLLFTEHLSGVDGAFNEWFVNGTAYDIKTMPVTRQLTLGRRYRLRLGNASNNLHPIHLHRHSFELTKIAGRPTSGVMKDVVTVAPSRPPKSTSPPIRLGSHCFTVPMSLRFSPGGNGKQRAVAS